MCARSAGYADRRTIAACGAGGGTARWMGWAGQLCDEREDRTGWSEAKSGQPHTTTTRDPTTRTSHQGAITFSTKRVRRHARRFVWRRRSASARSNWADGRSRVALRCAPGLPPIRVAASQPSSWSPPGRTAPPLPHHRRLIDVPVRPFAAALFASLFLIVGFRHAICKFFIAF